MSESKHTPGPWILSGSRLTSAPEIGRDTRFLSVGPDGDFLALVFFDMKTGLGHNDARLIAAAPDLLEVLKHILDSDMAQREEDEGQQCAVLNRARAIIAKAEGQTNGKA